MINEFIIQGRLTKAPTLEQIIINDVERKVCNFTLAQKNNNTANFYDVVAYDEQANYLTKYIKKADTIIVRGYIKQFVNKDNHNQYKFICDKIDFCCHSLNNEKTA